MQFCQSGLPSERYLQMAAAILIVFSISVGKTKIFKQKNMNGIKFNFNDTLVNGVYELVCVSQHTWVNKNTRACAQ